MTPRLKATYDKEIISKLMNTLNVKNIDENKKVKKTAGKKWYQD